MYYYNTSTKVTTWTEPSELKEMREKKAAAEPGDDTAAPTAAAAPVASGLASAQAKADAAAGSKTFLLLLVCSFYSHDVYRPYCTVTCRGFTSSLKSETSCIGSIFVIIYVISFCPCPRLFVFQHYYPLCPRTSAIRHSNEKSGGCCGCCRCR